MTEHDIEESAKVYLELVDGKWAIDPLTLDGAALDGLEDGPWCDYWPHRAEIPGDEAEAKEKCLLLVNAAPPLPNAEELFFLLAEALGYQRLGNWTDLLYRPPPTREVIDVELPPVPAEQP